MKSIVTSLTDETDLSEELMVGEAQPIVIDQEGEESDYEDDDWVPDPIDADPCMASPFNSSSLLLVFYSSDFLLNTVSQNLQESSLGGYHLKAGEHLRLQGNLRQGVPSYPG